MAVEPHMVKLATLNASSRDIERVHSALTNLENCETEYDGFSKYDEQFHTNLSIASHNRLILWFYRKLSEVRSHSQWRGMRELIINRENIKIYNSQHRAIYEALLNRDIDAAETAMIRHLEKARDDLIRSAGTSASS
jgi:GntR family transcriptional repressor for pyruvate dehydrogenase complex